MQLLRLPFKAREVLILQDYRKFSYFINTIIGYAWESRSVHGCFRRFKVSLPSFGRLLGHRRVSISEYGPSSELWRHQRAPLRYTRISTTCPSTCIGFRGNRHKRQQGVRGDDGWGSVCEAPTASPSRGHKATSAHVSAGLCAVLSERGRQL